MMHRDPNLPAQPESAARLKGRFRTTLWIVVVIACALILFLRFGGDILVHTDPLPRHADVAVVLNGSALGVRARTQEHVQLLLTPTRSRPLHHRTEFFVDGVAHQALGGIEQCLPELQQPKPLPASESQHCMGSRVALHNDAPQAESVCSRGISSNTACYNRSIACLAAHFRNYTIPAASGAGKMLHASTQDLFQSVLGIRDFISQPVRVEIGEISVCF